MYKRDVAQPSPQHCIAFVTSLTQCGVTLAGMPTAAETTALADLMIASLGEPRYDSPLAD
jgi:hypothetical protein